MKDKICPIMSAGTLPQDDWMFCQEGDCKFWQKDLGDKAEDGDGECIHVLVGTASYSMLMRMAQPLVMAMPQPGDFEIPDGDKA